MAEQKRVILAGATGMIGREVSKRLLQRGYELVVFSRDATTAREIVPGAAEYHTWQAEMPGPRPSMERMRSSIWQAPLSLPGGRGTISVLSRKAVSSERVA